MAEEFYIDDDLPVSSTVGWMQMEALLNKDLPVKKQLTVLSLLLSILPALLLISILLFTSLQLDSHLFQRTFIANNKQAGFNEVDNITSSLLIQDDNKEPGKSKPAVEHTDYTAFEFNNKADFPNPVKHQFNTDADLTLTAKLSIANFIRYFPEKKASVHIPVIAVTSFDNQLNSPGIVNADKKPPHKMPWEFSAGLGMNVVEGKQQNLQPYPTAEVKYNLNSRFFIAAGLSLLSPKPGTLSGITKTVYVNDTANNISLYNEVIAYDRLRYADVPLTAGVNITKKLMIQTGLQVSLLMSKQQKTSLQPYDFQMNSIDRPVNASLAGLAANPQQDFKVQQPKMDYRFIAGIKYKVNRTTAGLFYQHGLQSSATGSNTSGSSKGMFTLNLMYQVK